MVEEKRQNDESKSPARSSFFLFSFSSDASVRRFERKKKRIGLISRIESTTEAGIHSFVTSGVR